MNHPSNDSSRAASPGLMQRLRDETAADHERIERSLNILRSEFGTSEYRRLLEGYFGYFAPLEKRLGEFPDWSLRGFDFEERRKSESLRQDLRWLGHSNASLDQLVECSSLPDTSSFPRAVGCLYVLEGSTLGSQILLRRLSPLLGITASRGATFLAGYGSKTREYWNTFCQFAGELSAELDDFGPVIDAAQQTFRTLEQWMVAGAPTN